KCSECNYKFNEATKPAKKHFKIYQLVSNNKRKEYAELEKVYKTTNKKSDSNVEPILSTASSQPFRQSVINFAMLVLELTKTELSRTTNSFFPKKIANTINSIDYWNSVKNLLFILDQLVVGISIFENDTPRLS
ncbi:6775_t:CDS:2, partial [Gigaspora margarita]